VKVSYGSEKFHFGERKKVSGSVKVSYERERFRHEERKKRERE
jgi:hypothetical protein